MSQVDTFMDTLEHPLKAEIEAIRALILGVDGRIQEGIKWNAPSFYVEEHFATLKLRPLDTIQIVFHTGAKKRAKEIGITINDPSHLLKWVGADRGMVTLSDMADIQAKQAELQSLVQQWLAQM